VDANGNSISIIPTSIVLTNGTTTNTLNYSTWSGTATTTNNVAITNTNATGTFYIPLCNSTGPSQPLLIDSITGPLTYNPSTGLLTANAINTTNITITGGGGINYVSYQLDGASSSITLTSSQFYKYVYGTPNNSQTIILPNGGSSDGPWISITNLSTNGSHNMTIQYPSGTTIGSVSHTNAISGINQKFVWISNLSTWIVGS